MTLGIIWSFRSKYSVSVRISSDDLICFVFLLSIERACRKAIRTVGNWIIDNGWT